MYRARPYNCDFEIKAKNKQAALKAIEETGIYNCHETLEGELSSWGWVANCNRDYNIVELYFEGDVLGDDDKIIFSAIAPFVEAGSQIEIMDDENYFYRWYFDGQTVKEQWGELAYDKEGVELNVSSED